MASQEVCTEDQQDAGTLYSKNGPRKDLKQCAVDYIAILHGTVALKAVAEHLTGEQTHHESGFNNLNDLIFRYYASEAEVEEAVLLRTHYRDGNDVLREEDLGVDSADGLSLNSCFEAFLKSKRLLMDKGQKLQHIVLYTNRGVSTGLESKFAKIATKDLDFPVKQLLEIDGLNCQKFYKFQHPDSCDLDNYFQKSSIYNEEVYWSLTCNDEQFKSLKLAFLKSLLFAVQQPHTEQLIAVQRDIISGMKLYANVPENDRNLILQLFHGSVYSWVQAKKGEEVRAWTIKRTEKCLAEAKAKVLESLETGPDGGSETEQHEDVLVAASLTGHARAVEILLDKGCDANATWRDGMTLLHAATHRGHTDVVKVLLAKGCDVDAREHGSGPAAIHIASSKDHMAIATLLLDHGCNTDVEMCRFEHPLIEAASRGLLGMVQLLLDKRCYSNAQMGPKQKAMEKAVSYGHLDVAKLLLERGCDVRDVSGYAVHRAAGGGHIDMLQWLAELGCQVYATSSVWGPPLQTAAEYGHLDLVKLFLINGCNVDAGTSYASPLSKAASNGHVEVVRLLLEHGCDVNLHCENHRAIHGAAKAGDATIVKLLASHGADLHVSDTRGMTALHYAVQSGKKELVEYLLQQHCDANAASGGGTTPLHSAISAGNVEVARLLIDSGCSLEAAIEPDGADGIEWFLFCPDFCEGMTPLLYAVVYGSHLDLVELLLARGCDVNKPNALGWSALHLAACTGAVDTVALLLRHGARLDAKNEDGVEALHVAVTTDAHLDVVALLLDRGSNVNATTTNGRTALHFAALFTPASRVKTVQMLIERGCDASAATADGHTALHYAAMCGHCAEGDVNEDGVREGGMRAHVVAAAVLINNGCDITAKNADGQTALDVALDNTSTGILKLLKLLDRLPLADFRYYI